MRGDRHFGNCDEDLEFEDLESFMFRLQNEHSMKSLKQEDDFINSICRQRRQTGRSTKRTMVDIVQTTTMKNLEVENVKIVEE